MLVSPFSSQHMQTYHAWPLGAALGEELLLSPQKGCWVAGLSGVWGSSLMCVFCALAEGQNVGNFLTDRPSSRVLAAPGGASQIFFSDGGPAPAKAAPAAAKAAPAATKVRLLSQTRPLPKVGAGAWPQRMEYACAPAAIVLETAT